MIITGFLEVGTSESITVDGTVKVLSASCYKPTTGPYNGKEAVNALITLETNKAKLTLDGTTPVAGAAGHLLLVGDAWLIEGYTNIKRAKFTKEEAGSGVFRVSYSFQ